MASVATCEIAQLIAPTTRIVIRTGRMPAPYETLGLQPGAEPEVVEAAYRALMKKYHPDRWRGPPDEGHERAQAINAAYSAIKTGIDVDQYAHDATRDDPAPQQARSHSVIPPPINVGQRLAWACGISVVMLALAAMIATAGG
ncbi:J domain-containing protein [Sphingomonas endolithica]|uniref:J domain-containing protein n=1 Tax=Sphingomonas endolithica TaxID=2972485 RepID=UPI002897B5DA|nr:DnaJ domain-containing protein [Sphingomonas sp. ZFBP2030]